VLINDGLGNGGTSFRKTNISGDTWSSDVVIGDFNNDSKNDIFFTLWGEKSSLLLNNGGGIPESFSKRDDIDDSSPKVCSTFGDFNMDGVLDIYETVYGGQNKLWIGKIKHKKMKGSKSGIRYVCKDTKAINYSYFGRHKASLCKYKENAGDDKKEDIIKPTEQNPFNGRLCSEDRIIHDFMKYGDTNGKYSSYNNGIVTEISILQSHINRLLKDEYGEQAAGPVDIWFRSKTKEGVRRLQKRLNQLLPNMVPLVIDGIVGPFTREAINHSC
jgi:hypothetical protein